MILLKKNIKLTKDFSEKDYFTSFSVPRGIKKISLLFSYSPDQVTDRSLFSQSVSEAIKKYYGEFDGELDQLKVENFDTIKNLLTISLDCNGRFIGNRHKWESNQTIEISKNKVTPGFISPHMIEGEWGVTIHCHQIFTELVNVELKVVGEYDEVACG